MPAMTHSINGLELNFTTHMYYAQDQAYFHEDTIHHAEYGKHHIVIVLKDGSRIHMDKRFTWQDLKQLYPIPSNE